jgi:hypothetical protein
LRYIKTSSLPQLDILDTIIHSTVFQITCCMYAVLFIMVMTNETSTQPVVRLQTFSQIEAESLIIFERSICKPQHLTELETIQTDVFLAALRRCVLKTSCSGTADTRKNTERRLSAQTMGREATMASLCAKRQRPKWYCRTQALVRIARHKHLTRCFGTNSRTSASISRGETMRSVRYHLSSLCLYSQVFNESEV